MPAHKLLENENIFVMTEERAVSQDIRPLKILILNLMPTKIETETQILRLLSNSPIQVEAELLQTATHEVKNVSKEHMLKFYKTFDDIKNERFDGMVVTGAPVENMEFEQVDYWDELCRIFEWSKTNVYSSFFICWGAQAALYYKYGLKKYQLDKKMFGVFEACFARHFSSAHARTRRQILGASFKAYGSQARRHRADKGSSDTFLFREIGCASDIRYGVPQFFLDRSLEYDRDTLAKRIFPRC